MQKRTVNTAKLREAIEAHELGKIGIAAAGHVSMSWIEKALSGRYTRSPQESTMDNICRATKLSKDVLFPLAARKRA